jgi:hypothetical protein
MTMRRSALAILLFSCMSSGAAAQQPKFVAEYGKWLVFDVTLPATGVPQRYAFAKSEPWRNSFGRDVQSTLFVTCNEYRTIDFSLNAPGAVFVGHFRGRLRYSNILVRLSDGEAQKTAVTLTNASDMIFLADDRDTDKLLAKMVGPENLFLRLPLYAEGDTDITVSLKGAPEAIASVTEFCASWPVE